MSNDSSLQGGLPTLEDLLNLEQLDLNLFRSRASQRNINGALFGGQILGQGLRAAAMTVEGRRPHSLHGYFLLPGSLDMPVIYDVEFTRDGGSFSTRRVVARQKGRTIFSMEVSFHREESGFEHEHQLGVEVPDPEGLLNMQQIATQFADRLPPEAQRRMSLPMLIETRPVNFEDFYLRRAQTSRGLYWIRVLSAISGDEITQMAGLAYLSDWGLAAVATQQHVITGMNSDVMLASLDHALWFHRPARLDDWLLVEADSPFAAGGRGLLRGHIYDRNRKLVASVAQEALIRPVRH
jgi:acyl-CoA thioesterase-2